MKKVSITLLVVGILLFLSGCSVLEQTKTLTQCSYNLTGISNVKIAGVSLDKVTDVSQLNLMDAAKIVAAIASKTAQISFDANVAVKNPTVNTATINKLDWKILLEGNEILEGTKTTPTVITGNGTTNATINASVDAVKLLNKNTLDDVINLYKSIKGTSNTKSNISVKVKPTINNYTAPAYITINSSI
ncbi:MAG: hypothetical protein J6U29_02055 [Bacteroidales bacterium]|nr:hypothetical protein [Bacteroidales bacterium]